MNQHPPTPPQEPPPEPYALPWETVGTNLSVGPYDNLPEPKQQQPPAPDADGDWYESRS